MVAFDGATGKEGELQSWQSTATANRARGKLYARVLSKADAHAVAPNPHPPGLCCPSVPPPLPAPPA